MPLKANHTPGPWHAETSDHYTLGGDMIEISLHDSEGMICDQIASVMLDTGDDTAEDQKRYKEQEANAHLIAAAPDLLAACEAVYEADEAAIKELKACGLDGSVDPKITAQLKAAIAHAKGQP